LKEKRLLVDEITDELKEKGVIFFTPENSLNIDEEFLVLPKDLTEIPSRLLGNYLNAFTQQRMYMRTLIGWQELVYEEVKRIYYDKSIPLYKELSKQKISETAKERIINNDEEVKEYFIKMKDEKKKLELLMYSLASIEDAIFLISREISRRNGDYEIESRNENVQNR
ncbi:MAG: hypothetical protein N3A63_10455, partial [Bacteroidetes bacterium]|nr:hypothetical protein [Bacteroidota bacterium]